MGNQINFFLTPSDFEAAICRIMQCEKFVILHWKSNTPQPNIIPNFDIEVNGKPLLQFYLARREDLGVIQMRHVPDQNYWAIDDLRSPVIELTRCYFDRHKLRRGRVYLKDFYFNNSGIKMTKSVLFTKWSKRVLAAMRKTLKLDPKLRAYIGPDTLLWMKRENATIAAFNEIKIP
jgi:hypothetical protein